MKKLLLMATILAANIWSANAQTQTEITTQQDSLVKINTKGEVISKNKFEYTYDAKGNTTKEITYKWSSNAWVLTQKIDYTYDANGNMLEKITSNWATTDWVFYQKRTYTFNEKGLETEQIVYNWSNNTWVNGPKYEYAYDERGNKTQEITKKGNGTDWQNSTKIDYSFDSNDNQTLQVNYSWLDNTWTYTSKLESSYNAQGKETIRVQSNWKTSEWVCNMYTGFTYDEQGNKTQQLVKYWDSKNNDWVNNMKYDFTYDASGNILEQIISGWDTTNNSWKNSNKTENTYDDRGNLTQTILSKWNGTAWDYTSKSIVTYDKYNNQTGKVSYSWKSGDWVLGAQTYTYFTVAYLKVTMPVQGLATVFADENLVVPAGYAYAMQYNAEGNYLNASSTLKKDEIIPGGQGYLFEAAGTDSVFVFLTTTKAPEGTITSCLSGVTVNTPQSNIGGTIYTLANGTQGMGFYHFTGTTLAAGKAFYSVAPPAAKDFIGFGEPTVILQINENDPENENIIFNLAGQRISKLQKGINIVNGKKVLR